MVNENRGSRFLSLIKNNPFLRKLFGGVYAWFLARRFSGSDAYWVKRYQEGGNSGAGSYHQLAEFKAEVLNDFVQKHKVDSVIEYGCGDGNQLRLAKYANYTGFDISPQALAQCKTLFKNDTNKSFKAMDAYDGQKAELTLSLDVVYHLVEDDVFETYIKRLFDSSTRFVIIFSSNTDTQEKVQVPHVRHRKFTDWVEQTRPDWKLIQHVPNKYPLNKETGEGSFADFYIFGVEG